MENRKEMMFYCIQVLYQRWNGYTGTSLFESWSLTFWNTLFTSLAVMIPGIFEQDMPAETLLSTPEIYSFGQKSHGFNLKKCGWWMLIAAIQSLIIYFMVYHLYGVIPFTIDQGLFATGDLAYSICVVFINFKLL
jgi:phospholipid-translocating ATPase